MERSILSLAMLCSIQDPSQKCICHLVDISTQATQDIIQGTGNGYFLNALMFSELKEGWTLRELSPLNSSLKQREGAIEE